MTSNKAPRRLQVVHPDCAGIDIGKAKHYVAVDPRHGEEYIRSFDAFTDDLEVMAAWLGELGVTVVAMEATGVYWIPVFEVLDRAGFEVHLVNPRACKQVSGRKSDVIDCQWLWQLMSYGLLKGAFRPNDAICVLRSYVRQRASLAQDSARSVQHMQKALTQMNVQLDNVISDITGKTGMAILRAIVAGERDGWVLAAHRDGRIKADEATLAKSLRGAWRDEHLFALTQALERYDHLQGQLQACHERILAALTDLAEPVEPTPSQNPPARSAQERMMQQALNRVMGVDLTAIPGIGVETALTLAAEVGNDLSRFPDSAHFCSWLSLAPGTRISGDKRLSGRAPRRTNHAGQALRLAAVSAVRSNSFIGAAHRARLRRLDKSRAVKATAHQLARLIYAMLTRGEAYVEQGVTQFEDARRQRQVRNLKRNAKSLGFRVSEDAENSVA